MKICFLCDEYPPARHGGVGSSTRVMARSLVEAGHQVRVAGVYSQKETAPDYEMDEGVEVMRLRRTAGRFSWIQARWMLYRKVAEWARSGEIDLIEVPDMDGWVAGWPSLPAPVTARLHGSVSYFAQEMGIGISRMQFRLEQASLRRADFLCSTSRYTAARTAEVFRLAFPIETVLYNPVEVPDEPPREHRSRTRVVFSGTLVVKKGIVSLIEAWPQAKAACPAAELHIYGKDGRAASGESMQAFLTARLNGEVGRSVFFHGHVSREELSTILRTARAAIFPSYSEAFAMAPMEAMAQGCPTIYSRRASGPELIEHGLNGLLIDPDDREDIAENLARVLTDDALSQRLGYAGWQRVREAFERRLLVARNIEFYRSCIDLFHGSGKEAAAQDSIQRVTT
jgi:glycosyltransferase involved in cell wall biosynthesis